MKKILSKIIEYLGFINVVFIIVIILYGSIATNSTQRLISDNIGWYFKYSIILPIASLVYNTKKVPNTNFIINYLVNIIYIIIYIFGLLYVIYMYSYG